MTDEQRARLDIEQIESFLRHHAHGETSVVTYQMLENPEPTTIDMAEEWISIAEKAAEGHDKTKEEA